MIFIDVIQQKRSVIARLNYALKESLVSTGEEKRWLLSSSRDKTIKTSGPGAGRRVTQERRVSVPLCRFFARGNWAGCGCIMPTFSKPSPFLFFIWGFPPGNFALKLSGGQQPHLWTAHFVAPNGTSFPNPIHDNAWASLKALQADLVRFVPKFRDPKKSVAELDAPTKSKTTWDFRTSPTFYRSWRTSWMLSMDKIAPWFSILPLSPAGFLAMQRTRRRTAPTWKPRWAVLPLRAW